MLREAEVAGAIDEEELASDNEVEEWGGIAEAPASEGPIDDEEEYVDEDRFTSVTVESVSVTKYGLRKAGEDSDAESGDGGEDPDKERRKESPSKSRPDRPKKRKKQFRYETKFERKVERKKIKAKKKARLKE